MPTLKQAFTNFKTGVTTNHNSQFYQGSTKYCGEEINQQHTPRRVLKTILNFLDETQFCQVNVVGIPGSGKTTLTNSLLHEIHTTRPEYQVVWGGANDLRNMREFISRLQKGVNYIVAFDDVSKALDKLKADEQTDVFETLTTLRHREGGGKICLFLLYHYSKYLLKGHRAQGSVTMFTSCQADERSNIEGLLGKNQTFRRRLNTFAKVYHSEFSRKSFELGISPTEMKTFQLGKPFRVALAVNLSKVHLMLFPKLSCPLCEQSKTTTRRKVEPEIVIEKIHGYSKKYGDLALKFLSYNRGHRNALNNDLRLAYEFAVNLFTEYDTDFDKLARLLQPKNQKRLYKKISYEKRLKQEIVKESEDRV